MIHIPVQHYILAVVLTFEHVPYSARTFTKAADIQTVMPRTIVLSSSSSSDTFAAKTLLISKMPIRHLFVVVKLGGLILHALVSMATIIHL